MSLPGSLLLRSNALQRSWEWGEQLIKRVMGHADGSVTAIYNRYGYVKEMRAALERWVAVLTVDEQPEPRFQAAKPAGRGRRSTTIIEEAA